MLSRIVNNVLLVIVGAMLGAVGTIAHQSVWRLGGFTIPWGLVLALLAYTALLIGLRLLARGRLPALVTAIGTILTVFVFAQKSSGGSVLLPLNALGLIWTGGTIVAAAAVLAWPDLSRARAEAAVAGNRLS